ncbi:hypothetical protein Gotri_023665 [Gossypium trilobum]|uniref:CCHC-type domain-containing protein n=1 Tax=Gossypium trilobum TaxID=34281 RepID=A0A7J9DKK8_9ROSI|nr:hypothetical protein [Gossypium trilobum]
MVSTTVIVKLLGRNIDYNAMHNRILFLWKPVNSIRLMDITNGFFRLNFRGLIGKVVKLDIQTDNQTKGRFARLAVYINLEKPLILQVIVDGAVQLVEYEALPTVCFSCGKYGHVKETCPSVATDKNPVLNHDESSIGVALPNGGSIDDETTGSRSREKELEFGPWMLGERKSSRWGKQDLSANGLAKQTKNPLGSRFSALMVEKDLSDDARLSIREILREKANVEVAANSRSFKTKVNKKGVGGSLVDAGHRGNVGLDSSRGPVMNDNLGSVAVESLRQNSKDSLDKSLGKKPMGLGGSKHAGLQNNIPIDDVSGQGNLDSRNQDNIEVEDLDKIKAHYNLMFDESKGFIVPIFDITLDPVEVLDSSLGSNLTSPKDRRSDARDSAESMEAMAELLSLQILSKNSNAELDRVGSNLEDNIGLKS